MNSMHPYILFYFTASSDYTAGPYTVSFSAGQQSATLMVSTIDDDTVELSEYFTVMITSLDRPDVTAIGSPDTSVITIEDNEPGNMLPCDIAYTYVRKINKQTNKQNIFKYEFFMMLEDGWVYCLCILHVLRKYSGV